MELRTLFNSFGIDITDPYEFYRAWAAWSIFLSQHTALTKAGQSDDLAVRILSASLQGSMPLGLAS